MSSYPCQNWRPLPRAFRTALIPLCLLLSAAAAEGKPSVNVSAGLGGYFRPDRVVPVRLLLQNPDDPTTVTADIYRDGGPRGQMDARLTGVPLLTYRTPDIPLQGRSQRSYTAYALASRLTRAPVTVSLRHQGRQVQKLDASGEGLGAQDRLLVAVGAELGSLHALAGQKLPVSKARAEAGRRSGSQPVPGLVRVASLTADELPDRWDGYAAADVLLLGNVPASDLTSQQQQAIADWVSTGGTVVVTGGAQWQRLRDPWFQTWLPVSLHGSTLTGSAASLSAWSDQPAPSGKPFVQALARPRAAAQEILGGAGGPLAVRGRFGLGSVIFLAFDPAAPPFKAWDGANALWRKLLERTHRAGFYVDAVVRAEIYINQYYGPTQGEYLPPIPVIDAAAVHSQAALPDLWAVLLFLGTYILLIAPVNYLVLRRLRRLELIWVTSIGIVVLFTAGAYAIGVGAQGGPLRMTRASVVESSEGVPRARYVTYSGVFAPRKDAYGVTAEQAGARLQLLAYDRREQTMSEGGTVVTGAAEKLDDIRLELWETALIRGSGIVDLGGAFQRVKGPGGVRLVNHTKAALEGGHLVDGDRAFPLPTIPSGGSVPMPILPRRRVKPRATSVLPPQIYGGLPATGSPETTLKRNLIQNFTAGLGGGMSPGSPAGSPTAGHPLLVGWLSTPPLTLRVNGGRPPGPAGTFCIIHLVGPE